MSITIDINVCRVCCKSDASNSLLSYAKKFQYCTQIQVLENDGLPTKICDNCIGRLKIAFEFKTKSESSDKQLRSFINKVNSQFQQAVDCIGESEDNVENLLDDEDFVEPRANVDLEQTENRKIIISQEKFRVAPVIQEKRRPVVIKPEREEEYQGIIEVLDVVEQHEPIDNNENQEEERQQDDEMVVSETEIGQPQVIYLNLEQSDTHLCECDDESDYQTQNESETYQTQESYIESDAQDEQAQEQTTSFAETITIQNGNEVFQIMGENVKQAKKESKDTEFHCTKCDKFFSTRTNLYRHLHTHDGSKPYSCQQCDAKFTQNGSLKQHMLIHTGQRPYVCRFCDRGFTQSKSLSFHIRRHTGEKPFLCPKCNLSFRQKDGLKRHVLVKHADPDTKPQTCPYCKKVLNSKYSLNFHIRRHHGDCADDGTLAYKCEICGQRFSSEVAAIEHATEHATGDGMSD